VEEKKEVNDEILAELRKLRAERGKSSCTVAVLKVIFWIVIASLFIRWLQQ
jgi:hypothetical protein